jgi:hypothetical protein
MDHKISYELNYLQEFYVTHTDKGSLQVFVDFTDYKCKSYESHNRRQPVLHFFLDVYKQQ